MSRNPPIQGRDRPGRLFSSLLVGVPSHGGDYFIRVEGRYRLRQLVRPLPHPRPPVLTSWRQNFGAAYRVTIAVAGNLARMLRGQFVQSSDTPDTFRQAPGEQERGEGTGRRCTDADRRDAERLILDRQQRLTSLLQVSAPRPAGAHPRPARAEIERWRYVDMQPALDPNADREEAVVSLPADRQIKRFGRDAVASERTTRHCGYTGSLSLRISGLAARRSRGIARSWSLYRCAKIGGHRGWYVIGGGSGGTSCRCAVHHDGWGSLPAPGETPRMCYLPAFRLDEAGSNGGRLLRPSMGIVVGGA